MALTSTAEKLAAETDNFDGEKALNTKGFAEFLALFHDTNEGEISPEDMKERFEVFEIKNEVAVEIKNIYSGEIKNEIGISLDQKDLKCIDVFLNEQAVENPQTILEMQQQIQHYFEFSEQIEAAQSELEDLARTSGYNEKITEILKKDQTVEIAAKGTGWGAVKMYAGVIKSLVKGEYNEQRDILRSQRVVKAEGVPITKEALGNRRTELEKEAMQEQTNFESLQNTKTKEMNAIVDRLASLKFEMFAYAGLREQITAVSREKLAKNIVSVSRRGGIKGYADSLNALSEKRTGEETGIEYLSDDDEEKMREIIDKQAEKYVQDTITDKLWKMKLGTDSFKRLEQSLGEVITSGEIGSKSEEESREFILDTLVTIAHQLPTDTEGKAKKIMIKQLIVKLQNN